MTAGQPAAYRRRQGESSSGGPGYWNESGIAADESSKRRPPCSREKVGADTTPQRRPQQPLNANTKARNSIPQQKRFMALTPVLRTLIRTAHRDYSVFVNIPATGRLDYCRRRPGSLREEKRSGVGCSVCAGQDEFI
jgi:hypothetical protein